MGIELLLENATTNGDGAVIEIRDGGYRNIKTTGVFGGATITLNIDYVDGDYAPLVEDNIDQTITKIGDMNLQPFKTGMRIKATITGATGTTNITSKLL